MPVMSLQQGFRGLNSEQHESRLSGGEASDLLNVDVRDGSLRSRAGYDNINTNTMAIRDLVAFDRMDRANTIASAGTLTSGHSWVAIPTDDGTIDFEVWNGTLRGANEGTQLESAAVLTESDGSTNPLANEAHLAVEFDIRKYQGFGNTLRAFSANVDEFLGRFSVVFRTDVTDYLGGNGGTVGDDGYEVEFVVPVGTEGGADQSSTNGNMNMRWNDIDVEVFRRDDGVGRTTLGSATTVEDGGPGVDEWMHVKIEIYGTTTVNIKVYVNGSQIVGETDSSGDRHESAGFVKIRCSADGAAGASHADELALKRQIQIANFQVYALDNAGSPKGDLVRVENIHRHTQADGDAYLLAHGLTADGALVAQRPAGDGTSASAVFYSQQPGFATDNSDAAVTALKLNRRNGFVTSAQPTLDYTLGSDRFTITDSETGQKGLGDYTFAAGDRVHVIGAFASTTVDASSSSGQTTLNVTSTAGFNVGQVIRIDPNGANEEIGTIDAITGVSSGTFTMAANLQNSHTNSVVVAEELDNDLVTYAFASTTVDADSGPTESNPRLLNVAATTDFVVGQSVRINPDGPREEVGVIESIQSGASLTLVSDLVNAHTAVQGDTVEAESIIDTTPLGLISGIYDIITATSTVLTVKGVPSTISSLTSLGVVYRILSKHQGDGIASIMNNNTYAADFASAEAATYIADGSDRVHRSNGEAFYPAGIKKPTVKPILGSTGSSSGIMKSDRYTYRFALWNPLLGLESSPSPVSLEQTVADEAFLTLNLSQGDNRFDDNATHMRLYRLNASDSQTRHFRTRDIPIPIDNESGIIIIEDRTGDVDLSVNNNPPQQDLVQADGSVFTDFAANDPPPEDTILCTLRLNRMFYVQKESTTVFFSQPGVPDYVSPFSGLEVGPGDGQVIRAIVTYRDQLVVLKDRSLWVVVGETARTLQVQRMSDSVGCSSHMAVTEADDGLLYFAGEMGIHRWNGQFTEDLHFGIRSTYYGLNQARLDKMAMADDPEDQRIILSVTQSGQSEQDRWLVLNYRRPGVQVEGGVIYDWTLWGLEATCFALDPMVGGNSDIYRRKLRFGTPNGIVATFRGDDGTALTDDGTGISWHWEGPKLNFGTGRDKRFRYLTMEIDKTSVSSDVLVGHKIDEETSATTSRFDQSEVTRKLHPVRRRGQYIRPRFAGESSTVQSRILTYSLNFDHLGRR